MRSGERAVKALPGLPSATVGAMPLGLALRARRGGVPAAADPPSSLSGWEPTRMWAGDGLPEGLRYASCCGGEALRWRPEEEPPPGEPGPAGSSPA